MSFLGGVKRIFGLTDDEMDEQDYVVSDRNSAEDVVTEVKKNNDVEIFDEQGEIPDGVFDGLIEIVNSNLSPLVLKCIDVEAEKKYLYDALGTRFADFVKATREKSLNAARVEWEKEKYELKSKAEEMKSRCATAEANSSCSLVIVCCNSSNLACISPIVLSFSVKAALSSSTSAFISSLAELLTVACANCCFKSSTC